MNKGKHGVLYIVATILRRRKTVPSHYLFQGLSLGYSALRIKRPFDTLLALTDVDVLAIVQAGRKENEGVSLWRGHGGCETGEELCQQRNGCD